MADTKLFNIKGAVKEYQSGTVTLEKELQTVIENNMNIFFGVTFLAFEYPRISATSFPTKYGSLLIVIVRISPNSGLLKIFKSFISLTPFLLHPLLVFFRMTINVFFDVPHQRIHAAYLLFLRPDSLL